MKLWITGSGGVLGRNVVEAAKAAGHEVATTTHWECPIDSLGCVGRAHRAIRPDVIINCAGRLPGAPSLEMIMANALGPHILASFGTRLIQMSTDCVYSGQPDGANRFNWSTGLPDPWDLYGRTKLAGEVDSGHVLNVRGSFVSREAGFLKWLLEAEGEVEAWDNAEWNGTTVEIMAAKLVELAEGGRTGLVHAASPQVTTKGWMVGFFAHALDLPVTVVRKARPAIYRALAPDVNLPDVEGVMKAYARELKRCPSPA